MSGDSYDFDEAIRETVARLRGEPVGARPDDDTISAAVAQLRQIPEFAAWLAHVEATSTSEQEKDDRVRLLVERLRDALGRAGLLDRE